MNTPFTSCPVKGVHIIRDTFFSFMIQFSYRFLRRLRTVFLISRSVSVLGCCIDS